MTLLPNGKVLIAGGSAGSSAELYDPATGVFTPTGNMTTSRILHTATLLPDGKVLIVGGNNSPNNTLATAELYDPATAAFTPTGSMTVARQEFTATLLPNGKVLIAGGGTISVSGTTLTLNATAELYDPASGIFNPTGMMNSPRLDQTATLLPTGQVLVAGGGSGLTTTNGVTQVTQLTASVDLYDPVTGIFTPTGAMSTPRVLQGATLLPNGKVLISGGGTSNQPFTVTASAEVYDPAAGSFSPTGSMSAGRAGQGTIVLPSGRVLIAGGFGDANFSPLSSIELYNPAAGAFSAKGSMNVARSKQGDFAALLPTGNVLFAGGNSADSSAELFFPTDPPFLVQKFTTSGSLNTGRLLHTATLLNNGLVLIAGGSLGGSTGAFASAELYDPATGTFTATGSMNTGRQYHTATLLNNGLVLIAGGFGPSGAPLASAELYNPATGTFTATGSMTTARYSHTATLLPNGTVLIAGLGTNIAVASAEIYNPATGTFTATGGLNTARYRHTATLQSNGLVLIAGGVGFFAFLPGAVLYNPATGTFTATGSLNTARSFHTATLLNNGLVLIAGGADASGVPLASAELYDPATGTFTATGSLNTARVYNTATLLNNGLVLIAGGFGGNINSGSGVHLASAELYNPATGTFTAAGSLNIARYVHTATLLPTGKVLVAGGVANTGPQATSELYQFGTIQQLQPQSCSYEGHIKSVAAFSTPTAVRFVNNSANLTFQVFWLDYNGNRVLYATLGPGQSFIQQTFLTHPWVIADTSPAATCQEIYLPLQEQAPAIFPPGQ